jgi:antirestriction protein ArdC
VKFLDEFDLNAHRLAIWTRLRRTVVALLNQPEATRELFSEEAAQQNARVSDRALLEVLDVVHDIEKQEADELRTWRHVRVDEEATVTSATKPAVGALHDLSELAKANTPPKSNRRPKARSD